MTKIRERHQNINFVKEKSISLFFSLCESKILNSWLSLFSCLLLFLCISTFDVICEMSKSKEQPNSISKRYFEQDKKSRQFPLYHLCSFKLLSYVIRSPGVLFSCHSLITVYERPALISKWVTMPNKIMKLIVLCMTCFFWQSFLCAQDTNFVSKHFDQYKTTPKAYFSYILQNDNLLPTCWTGTSKI